MKLGRQALDGGIADIDAIQKCHHVNNKEYRPDHQVKLPKEPALGLGVDRI